MTGAGTGWGLQTGGGISEPFAQQSESGTVTTCLLWKKEVYNYEFVFSNLRNTTCGSFFEKIVSWNFAK